MDTQRHSVSAVSDVLNDREQTVSVQQQSTNEWQFNLFPGIRASSYCYIAHVTNDMLFVQNNDDFNSSFLEGVQEWRILKGRCLPANEAIDHPTIPIKSLKCKSYFVEILKCS